MVNTIVSRDTLNFPEKENPEIGKIMRMGGDGSSTQQETVASKNRTYTYGTLSSSIGIPPNLNRHETRKFLAQSRKSSKKRR